MEQFRTLVEAAEIAATRTESWRYAYSDNEIYDRASLLIIAEVSDAENPVDEDSFYVVSPRGAIGFYEDGENIDWLFLSGTGTEDYLPSTLQTASQINFCSQCSSAVVPGARFCGQCGKAL